MLKQIAFPDFFTKEDIRREDWDEIEKKIDAIIREMTAQEKLDLLYGGENPESVGKLSNAGYLRGVPRLGVPEIRMYDGPAGVTSIEETTGLPAPVVLASTWSNELAYDFGRVAGSENAAIAGNFQLGTQLDTIRTPHFPRDRDMKGEDYFLNGCMSVNEVKGVQDQGVVAVLKHFAVANINGNNDMIVDEQTLHETYLRPFEMAVKEAGAGAVMCAYNKLNGHFCTDSEYLLKYTLRELWNFKGAVMSDWGGNHNLTIGKGMDMEMPRPAYNSDARILKGIQKGRITWDDVNHGVKHVLESMGLVGLLSLVELDEDGRVKEEYGRTRPIQMQWSYEEQVRDGLLERNAETAYTIAKKGIVMLKNNDRTLPVREEDYTGGNKIALIGLGAVHSICGQLQERSFGRLSRMTSPFQEMKKVIGKDNIIAEVGIDIVGETIPAECLYVDAECNAQGITRTYGILEEDIIKRKDPMGQGGNGLEFQGFLGELDEDGEPVEDRNRERKAPLYGPMGGKALGGFAQIDSTINFTCGTEDGEPVKNYKNSSDGTAFSNKEKYTWKAYLKAPESGNYILKLESIGGRAVFGIYMDDEWKIVGESEMREGSQWPWESIIPSPEGMGIYSLKVNLQKEQVYPIIVYGAHLDRIKDFQIRTAWITPSFKKENHRKAIEAAQNAKKIVYFMNDHNDEVNAFVELFGGDMNLDNRAWQLNLLKEIHEIAQRNNAKLVVVLQSAKAHTMKDWIDLPDALVVTYLPGQEGGRAISDILLGKVNPSGKLVQSYPADNRDTPVTDSEEHLRRREKGIPVHGKETIAFTEGIFYGYRWHDKYGIDALFPFGYGLSYTSFEYSDLEIVKTDNGFEVKITVENTGECMGDEIVQLYLGSAEVPSHIQMAKKQLAGYARVENIKPGERRRVLLTISKPSMCYWNPVIPLQLREDGTKDKWELAAGKREIYIGSSSRDIKLKGTIIVE